MTDQLLDVNQHKFDLTIRLDGSAPSLANSKILNTYQRYLYATPGRVKLEVRHKPPN